VRDHDRGVQVHRDQAAIGTRSTLTASDQARSRAAALALRIARNAFGPATASMLTSRDTVGSDATDVLDTRTRALISVTITATLGTLEPLRGQLRIALNNGVTPEEIVEAFIHIEAYVGAARAFDSYQIAQQVFQEARAAEGPEGD
jgi:alkylhydroperoxidase/carboxymuconolactone decarboxylase family protein YurZ